MSLSHAMAPGPGQLQPEHPMHLRQISQRRMMRRQQLRRALSAITSTSARWCVLLVAVMLMRLSAVLGQVGSEAVSIVSSTQRESFRTSEDSGAARAASLASSSSGGGGGSSSSSSASRISSRNGTSHHFYSPPRKSASASPSFQLGYRPYPYVHPTYGLEATAGILHRRQALVSHSVGAPSTSSPSSSSPVVFLYPDYAPCGVSKNVTFVGFQGKMGPPGGTNDSRAAAGGAQVSGLVTVYDDCYFAISDLIIKPSPSSSLPGLSLWAGPSGEDPFYSAAPIDPQATPLQPPLHIPTLAVFLEAGGLTWGDIGAIFLCSTNQSGFIESVYAELALPGESQLAGAFSKNVVEVRKQVLAAAAAVGLVAPPPPAQPSPPPPAPPAPTSGPSAGLLNCIEAVSGKLNIYWSVTEAADGTEVVEFGLEAKVGDDSWIAFGMSRNQTQPEMLQSDVTMTGAFPSSGASAGGSGGFAVDFFITALEPCSEVAGGYVGVCPDSTLGSSAELDNVRLRSASRSGDVTFVRYTRPARTADSQYDIDLLPLPSQEQQGSRQKGSAGSAAGGSDSSSSSGGSGGGSGSSSREAMWAVFATGPLAPDSTAANPRPLFHDWNYGYVSGGIRITISRGSPVFACTNVLWGSPAMTHPTMPPYVPPPPPGAPASPPPAPPKGPGGSIGAGSNCDTQFAGQAKTFRSCASLPGGYIFYWSLTGLALTSLFIAPSVPAGGYAAVGVSPEGIVVGSSLLIVQRSSSGALSVSQFYAAGWALGEVAPGGTLAVVDVRAEESKGDEGTVSGGVGGSSSTSSGAPTAAVRVLMTVLLHPNQTAAAYLVWTKGAFANATALSADGLVGMYTSAISFASGNTSASADDGGGGSKSSAWAAHGGLAVAAWGVVMPAGVMAARYMRKLHPYWFLVHQTCQLSAFALGVAAFTLGWMLPPSPHGSVTLHAVMGAFVFVLSLALVTAFAWRPAESSGLMRQRWRVVHACGGVLVLILSISQMFIGLQVAYAASAYTMGLVAWLFVLVLVFAALESRYGDLCIMCIGGETSSPPQTPPSPNSPLGGRRKWQAPIDKRGGQGNGAGSPYDRHPEGEQRQNGVRSPTHLVWGGDEEQEQGQDEPPVQATLYPAEGGLLSSAFGAATEAAMAAASSDFTTSPGPSVSSMTAGEDGSTSSAITSGNRGGSSSRRGLNQPSPSLSRSWSLSWRSGELKYFGENPVVQTDRFNVKATAVRQPDFLAVAHERRRGEP